MDTPHLRHVAEPAGSTQTLFIFPNYKNYSDYTKKYFLKYLGKMIYNQYLLFYVDTDTL